MESQYKIVIVGRNLYKEVELPQHVKHLKLGTSTECDVRLRPDLFFDSISLDFSKNDDGWIVNCSDNIYISLGDVRKLFSKRLQHGDEFTVRYQESGNDVFNVSFSIDFDNKKRKYDVAIDIQNMSSLRIGGPISDIELRSDFINNDYFEIKRIKDKLILVKDSSKYGVYLNGIRIEKDQEIFENDFISFAEFTFCYARKKLYTESSNNIRVHNLDSTNVDESSSRYQYPKFNRSTRVHQVLNTEKIAILDPPAAPQKPKTNIVMQLMPAIAMLAVTVILRGFVMNSGGSMSAYIWISAISMGLGIITSIVSIIDERKQYKKDTKERVSSYQQYIDNKEKKIEEYRQREADQLETIYYSIEKEIEHVQDFAPELFDRVISDDDFLITRLGTGNVEAVRIIDYKKQEKFSVSDDLAEKPSEIAKKYKYIRQAPVTLDLKQCSAVGIVGDEQELYDYIKLLTVDLATRHYFSDLHFTYILGDGNTEKFSWLRFLPHLQNDVLQMRNIVCDEDSKNYLFEYLYKELSSREGNKKVLPHLVIFVYSDMGIKKHPISKYIEIAASWGVHFIFFERSVDLLPTGCRFIVNLHNNSGEVIDCFGEQKTKDFCYEPLADEIVENVVFKLAPIFSEEVSLAGTLTRNISLYEMLGILNVNDIDLEKNWSSSQVYRSMAAPLGVKTKSEIVYLDLHEKKHGPHGLVAGTTGSGKSEIIQTYILSMATLFHPYEIGFVIIDFKGGGMVNQFKDLPHLIGAITNIDGREINRSLLSIKAELRKRQSLFAKCNVNHIDQYIKLYKKGEAKTPLPHLILIVDEFAELKMDQPEFMKELISVARIGRSLGVHLILATQKPSGVVDAQIWSNSKFKLCLKVQNKEDSNEVLKTPLAAEIKEPGRAYLQVGNNEIFELFQSAYSGAAIDIEENNAQKSFEINKLDFSGKRTHVYVKKVENKNTESETQLMAMVNYVAAYCKSHNIDRLPGICLPPLEENIEYPRRTDVCDSINTIVSIGVFDDPDNQRQCNAQLDILAGNTVIIGSSQYGKTNLLQVILRGISEQYAPSDVNVYILDFASMALKIFDEMHHVGGVITASEDEKMKNFMRMIRQEIKRRKEVFSKMGITSFTSYREAGIRDIPHIVVLVDNFIALKELYSEYEEDVLHLCREGVAVGISLVITSLQTNGISYKYMSNFSNRICLYCNQGDEYSTLFDRCRMQPKNVPGRGLIAIDKTVYEYQTYLAFMGEKEIDRVKEIRKFVSAINSNYPDSFAYRIPEVPNKLNLPYVAANLNRQSWKALQVPVGIDYDTVEFTSVDLEKTITIGVTGREGYGKTNLVKIFIQYLQENVFDIPSSIYILDDYGHQFEDVSAYGVVERYTADFSEFDSILVQIEEEMQKRLSMVQSSDLSILDTMPMILFIVQNNTIYSADGLSKTSVETFKRIVKTYRNMKLSFIFADVPNVAIAYNSPEMLKLVKDYDCMFIMDDLAKQKIVDVNPATVKKFKKPIELGDGYIINESGVQKEKFINLTEEV